MGAIIRPASLGIAKITSRDNSYKTLPQALVYNELQQLSAVISSWLSGLPSLSNSRGLLAQWSPAFESVFGC